MQTHFSFQSLWLGVFLCSFQSHSVLPSLCLSVSCSLSLQVAYLNSLVMKCVCCVCGCIRVCMCVQSSQSVSCGIHTVEKQCYTYSLHGGGWGPSQHPWTSCPHASLLWTANSSWPPRLHKHITAGNATNIRVKSRCRAFSYPDHFPVRVNKHDTSNLCGIGGKQSQVRYSQHFSDNMDTSQQLYLGFLK